MVTVHSFFLSGGTFTEYDVPGAVQTDLLSINDAGDFTGAFDPDGSGIFQAFVSVAGTITSYSVPGAAWTLAYEINNSKQLVVGYFIDSSGNPSRPLPGRQWGAALPDRSFGLRCDSPVWT